MNLEFINWILNNQARFVTKFTEHVELTGYSVILAILIAIPLAVLATRVRALAWPLNTLANFGQTIPSLAVLGLAIPFLGIGFEPALAALTIRAVLPIFLNTYTGIEEADPMIVDAAKGMGSTSLQRLRFAEFPLASPVVYAGIQTATVQNIGIATLATFIGGGGLGDLIIEGLSLYDFTVLLAGAIPVALFAMVTDITLRLLRSQVVPAALQQ